MRRALYNLGVSLYGIGISMAVPFHAKAKKWVQGRKGWKEKLIAARKPNERWVWFHCASLGEFEQGRNLIESIRIQYPAYKILLSFFSPSGYEIRNDYKGADYVCYLPLDQPANVKSFLDILQPSAVFFIKYEIWVNYLLEIRQRKIPAFLVSSLVRPGSRFLKGFFAPLFREAFNSFTIIFTQNEETKKLVGDLTAHPKIIVAGDTRFDRVLAIKNNFEALPKIEQFVGDDFCVVCGSTWPDDEEIILKLIAEKKNLPVKWIIAPHEIHPEKIQALIQKFPKEMISYSTLVLPITSTASTTCPDPIAIGFLSGSSPEPGSVTPLNETGSDTTVSHPSILWIDNIGMLSGLYNYSDFAFVGGAFGKLVHNTLEPAVFGNPMVFGPNYQRSDETIEMINLGTAFSVNDFASLKIVFEKLFSDQILLEALRTKNKEFVAKSAGATEKIIAVVKTYL